MKLLITLTLIAMVTASHNKTSAECLYCKKMDSFNSFMYSYSYCKSADRCLEQQWNYVNQYCTTNWKEGWLLDIDEDCEADEAIGVCKTFVATEGVEKRSYPTATLQAGQKCTITIDASQSLARLHLTSGAALGVLWNGYKSDDPITIPMGYKQDIVVYNGNRSGSMAIIQVFSSATKLSVATLVIISSFISL